MFRKRIWTILLMFVVCMSLTALAVGCSVQSGKDDDDDTEGDTSIQLLSVDLLSTNEEETTYEIVFSDGTTATFTVANGKNGTDGQNGLTPYIGENGNWWIGDTDTNIPARGQDGQDGQNGQDGLTPYIGENGNWWIGDTDTNIPARGQDGNDGQSGQDGVSISDAKVENGELILVLSNDKTINVGKVVGDNGKDGTDGTNGKDGVSITGAAINENGELILTLSNGTPVNTGSVKGDKGADGIGISNIAISEGNLCFYKTDGSEFIIENFTALVKGEKGTDGKDGIDGTNGTDGKDGIGIASIDIDNTGNLTILLSDETKISANIKGETGENGKDGISISSTRINENGELIISFSDGKESNLGSIIGAKGETGTGIKEITIDDSFNLIITLDDNSTKEIYIGNLKGEKGEAGQDGQDGQNGLSAYELYKNRYPEYAGNEDQWISDLVNGKLKTEFYTVTFKNGETIVKTISVAHGEKIKDIPENPIQDGKLFVGWFEENLNEQWQFSGFVVTEDVVLIAKFNEIIDEPSTTLDITELSENIERSENTLRYIIKQRNSTEFIDLFDEIKVTEGSTIKYFLDKNYQREVYPFSLPLESEGENIFYIALYSNGEIKYFELIIYKNKMFNVTFDNAESEDVIIQIEEDEIFSVADRLDEKYGYYFKGWTLSGGNEVVNEVKITSDTTFIGKFEPKEVKIKYYYYNNDNEKVYFDLIDTAYFDETFNFEYTDYFFREGYTFGYFYLNGGVIENITIKKEETYEIECHYSKNLYKISFEINSPNSIFNLNIIGNINETVRGSYNGIYILPDCSASIVGYEFIGWSVKGESEIIEAYTIRPMDITLSANWKAIEYKITDTNTGKAVQLNNTTEAIFTVENLNDEGIAYLQNLYKECYTFTGYINLSRPIVKDSADELSWYIDYSRLSNDITVFTITSQFEYGSEGMAYRLDNDKTCYIADFTNYQITNRNLNDTIIAIPTKKDGKRIYISNFEEPDLKPNSNIKGIIIDSNLIYSKGGDFYLLYEYLLKHFPKLEKVYFNGTIEELEDTFTFSIDYSNIILYSESGKLDDEFDYWHYDENGLPVIWE